MISFCGDKKDVTVNMDLLACPFCGTATLKTTYEDRPVLWADSETIARHFKIECAECGCHMSDYGYAERLIERWNGLTRLDQCPICHDYVRRYYESHKGGGYYVHCDKCGLTSPVFESEFEAHDFWNTRTGR